MTTKHEPAEVMVALPLATLRLLVGSIIVTILVMLPILAVEIAILLQVFHIADLLERLAPAA